jgi:hypothetical protein
MHGSTKEKQDAQIVIASLEKNFGDLTTIVHSPRSDASTFSPKERAWGRRRWLGPRDPFTHLEMTATRCSSFWLNANVSLLMG